jgi:hypothetical protein
MIAEQRHRARLTLDSLTTGLIEASQVNECEGNVPIQTHVAA